MKPRDTEVVIVSPESPWPARHGGRQRIAMLARTLASQMAVTVVHPARPDDVLISEGRLRSVAVETSPPSRLAGRLAGPRLGELFGTPLLPAVAQRLCAGAGGVLWSHSYLAAVGMPRVNAAVNIVDFANIESERFRSLAARSSGIKSRLGLILEAEKARRWEPRLASAADVSLAITERDYRWLSGRGARVILARNGLDSAIAPVPSPANGTVLAVANWDYAPNRDGMLDFVLHDWPVIRNAVGSARLQVVGAGGGMFEHAAKDASVTALGFVADLAPAYAGAAVVVAPAQAGGGSQLKVAEAWGHGRVVVGPLHLGREARDGLPSGALTPSADIAQAVIRMLEDVMHRHRVEAGLRLYAEQHSWDNELLGARDEVSRLLRRASNNGRAAPW